MRCSQTRDPARVSCIGLRILYHWATREAPFSGVIEHFIWLHLPSLRTSIIFMKIYFTGCPRVYSIHLQLIQLYFQTLLYCFMIFSLFSFYLVGTGVMTSNICTCHRPETWSMGITLFIFLSIYSTNIWVLIIYQTLFWVLEIQQWKKRNNVCLHEAYILGWTDR